MDLSPFTATITNDPLDSFPSNAKLRLMCSYGGHIVPRPHDKSLCYAGGDTRIVAVDRRTTASTLSSLTAHLSRTLYNNRPFFLKYQLPNEELDSLISVTTDEDLHNMIEENDRIASSPKASRIRLFLFPAKQETVGSILLDPKAESWFCDALKSTKIQSADSGLVNGLMGLDSDSSVEGNINKNNSNNNNNNGLDLCSSPSVPESIVLETSSSFGSTGSSISMSNLPPIGVHVDDGGVNKVKVASPGSAESDGNVASPISPQITICQDSVVQVPSMESRVSPHAVESESMHCDPASGIHMLNTFQVPTHQICVQSDHIQHQQDMRYVHQAGAHYIPQYPAGSVPVSSYYPMYYPPLQQQAHNPYQPNQPYPVYLMPVRPPQSYNMSMQCNLVDSATTALSQPQMHPPASMIASPVAYKEVMTPAPLPEPATKVYMTMAGATPLVHVPPNQNEKPLMDLSEEPYPSQPVAAVSTATAKYDNEYEDDLAYTQIYKTQPSMPALLSQYQTTMTNAGALLLSEGSKQPSHADNIKQLIGTSQPQ